MTNSTRLTAFAAPVAFFVLTLAPPAQAPAGPPPPPLAARIGDWLEAHRDHREFTGVALVADGGEIVYEAAFGRADDDHGVDNGPATKFRIGGVTQQFTAMLVLLLVEEGRLELDAPIAKYLADLPRALADRVTVHHLLGHTSGIPCYMSRPRWQRELAGLHSREDFIARFCAGPLEFEPGERYSHSHSGYYLLGAIVEAVTGQTFGAALRARVLDPLELRDTGCEDPYAVLEHRATGYEEVAGERRMAPWIDVRNLFASAGMYSTVRDLWKWERALCDRRLLGGELEARMFTPGEGRYGYGWHVDPVGIWHGGAVPGFSALIGRLPQRGQCVILLSNSGFASVPEAAQGVAAILAGRTPAPPSPRPWHLARTVIDGGIAAGLAAFAELPEATRFGEVEPALRLVGYRLLAKGRAREAVRVFAFNTRAFTEVSWRWESLGEAHMQAGDRQLAIECFERALALDPARPLARRLLAELLKE